METKTFDLPYAGKVLMHWEGPEHIHVHPNPQRVLIALVVLVAIVGYAIYTNSPLMAVTFILIGFVGYLFLGRDPRSHAFAITTKGIVVGRELYAYDSIESYWIFDEPPLENVLSLRSDGLLAPYIHIPVPPGSLADVDGIMRTYLPEEKQSPRAVDILEHFIHS